jgi:hypothetical protein
MECLLCKCEVLSSNPSPTKKKIKKEGRLLGRRKGTEGREMEYKRGDRG